MPMFIAQARSNEPRTVIHRSDRLDVPVLLTPLANTGYCCAFSHDGSLLAFGHQSAPGLLIYRTSDWSLVAGTPAFARADRVAWSPDGSMLAIGLATSPYLRVYSTATWALVSGGPSGTGQTMELSFSPDGSLLMHGFPGGCRVFNVNDWSVVTGTPGLSPSGGGWSPDSAMYAFPAGGSGAGGGIYETSAWTKIADVPAFSVSMSFSPDGALLAMLTNDATRLRLLRSSDWVQVTSRNAPSVNSNLSWAPDGSRLFAWGSGLWVFDAPDWSSASIVSPGGQINGLAISPNFAVEQYLTRRVSLDAHYIGWSGPDSIEAHVARAAESTVIGQRARVTLLRQRDKRAVMLRWSDSGGAVTFNRVDANRRYIALAEYPSNPDNPAAENYLRPVAGVSLKRGEGGS